MIFIYKDLVKRYIHILKKEDLEEFASKNNIKYTKKELDITYNFIMKYYEELLNENIKVFEILKPQISNTLYKKLINLYVDYKQKYI